MDNRDYTISFLHVQHQNTKGGLRTVLAKHIGERNIESHIFSKLLSSLPDLAFGSVALNETKDMFRIYFFGTDLMILVKTCLILLDKRENYDFRDNSMAFSLTDEEKRNVSWNDSGFYDCSSNKSLSSGSFFYSSQSEGSFIRGHSKGAGRITSSTLRNCSSCTDTKTVTNLSRKKNLSDSFLETRSNPSKKRGKIAISLVIKLKEHSRSWNNVFDHMTRLEECLGKLQFCVRTHFAKSSYLERGTDNVEAKIMEGLRDFECEPLENKNFLNASEGSKLFMHLLRRLEKILDTKETKFFLSTLCSAVLTHNHDWLSHIGHNIKKSNKQCYIILFGMNRSLLEELKTFLNLLLEPCSRLSIRKKRLAVRCDTCPLVDQKRKFILRRKSFSGRVSMDDANFQKRSRSEVICPKSCTEDLSQKCITKDRIRLIHANKKNTKWQSCFKDPQYVKNDIDLSPDYLKYTYVIGDIENYEALTLSTSASTAIPGGKLNLLRSSSMLSPLIGSAIEETCKAAELTKSAETAIFSIAKL
ncbi:uncharacterized protein LOC136031651 isoform X2 [Artemia franciscana]|uniref:uncharacterized protein LOC136031651 isoform X2 n=1 Tax=Artemia franciscana TaxID=6661 RepID=UPI0032DA4428